MRREGHDRSNRRDHFPDNHEQRANGGHNKADLNDSLLLSRRQGVEFVHQALNEIRHLLDDRGQRFTDGCHKHIDRAFQLFQGAAEAAHHGLRHFVRGAGAGFQGFIQFADVLRSRVDQRQPGGHLVLAEDGGCRGDLLRFGELTKSIMQLALDRDGVLHCSISIGDGDTQLRHLFRTFFCRGNQTGKACFQRVSRLVRFDAVVGHDTHVQGGVVDAITRCGKDRGSHGHSSGKAVHIQGGVITGGSKHIRVVSCLIKAAMEAVDRGDKPAGDRIKVAALTGCEVHGRRQGCGGLFSVQTGTGEIEGRVCRVLHAEGRIRSRVLHSLVQQLRFLCCVAHRLVGELHGLIHFGKARHTSRANSRKRHGHMRGKPLTDTLNLAAEFLHFLPGCRDLLCLHGAEVFILLLQTFQLLLGFRDLTLQSIILLL